MGGIQNYRFKIESKKGTERKHGLMFVSGLAELGGEGLYFQPLV